MKFEAAVLKQKPDADQRSSRAALNKLQIMMVPVDGKNFFANDCSVAYSGLPPNSAADEIRMERTGANEWQKRGNRKP